jgi:hypothetical protein
LEKKYNCPPLSPTTEASDRAEKAAAYGAMGVGWLWLLDADKRTIESFTQWLFHRAGFWSQKTRISLFWQ